MPLRKPPRSLRMVLDAEYERLARSEPVKAADEYYELLVLKRLQEDVWEGDDEWDEEAEAEWGAKQEALRVEVERDEAAEAERDEAAEAEWDAKQEALRLEDVFEWGLQVERFRVEAARLREDAADPWVHEDEWRRLEAEADWLEAYVVDSSTLDPGKRHNLSGTIGGGGLLSGETDG